MGQSPTSQCQQQSPPPGSSRQAPSPPGPPSPDGTEPNFSVPAAITSSRFFPASSFTTRATFSPSASIPTELRIFLMLASLTSPPPRAARAAAAT